MAYKQMPEVFSVLDFVDRVRKITNRPRLQDDSIKRRLREARADIPAFNYKCINNEKSIYKKTNGKVQLHNEAAPCLQH
jgi:hypothetical protein